MYSICSLFSNKRPPPLINILNNFQTQDISKTKIKIIQTEKLIILNLSSCNWEIYDGSKLGGQKTSQTYVKMKNSSLYFFKRLPLYTYYVSGFFAILHQSLCPLLVFPIPKYTIENDTCKRVTTRVVNLRVS